MLTKNKIKLIKSLEQKKFRFKHKCFVVEGEKMVQELIESSYKILDLYHTSDFQLTDTNINTCQITEKELRSISLLKTANKALALAEIPIVKRAVLEQELCLVLDNIQDPGNLGTIIRTANWFGVKNIYCSTGTVDMHNPKVVQSTMGAIFRTKITYCDLTDLINEAKAQNLPVFGTLLSGNDIYSQELSKTGLIVLGNESKGISREIEKLIDHKIKIPNYSNELEQMESLNVAIANAIVLAEFKRQAAL